jgi:hypothetical protein
MTPIVALLTALFPSTSIAPQPKPLPPGYAQAVPETGYASSPQLEREHERLLAYLRKQIRNK